MHAHLEEAITHVNHHKVSATNTVSKDFVDTRDWGNYLLWCSHLAVCSCLPNVEGCGVSFWNYEYCRACSHGGGSDMPYALKLYLSIHEMVM